MTTVLAPFAPVLRSPLSESTHGAAGLTARFITPAALQLSGELDLDGADVLRICAHRFGVLHSPAVIVDLGDLAFLDPRGAGLLCELARSLGARGTDLVVTRPQPQALRVLTLAGSIGPLGFDIAA